MHKDNLRKRTERDGNRKNQSTRKTRIEFWNATPCLHNFLLLCAFNACLFLSRLTFFFNRATWLFASALQYACVHLLGRALTGNCLCILYPGSLSFSTFCVLKCHLSLPVYVFRLFGMPNLKFECISNNAALLRFGCSSSMIGKGMEWKRGCVARECNAMTIVMHVLCVM